LTISQSTNYDGKADLISSDTMKKRFAVEREQIQNAERLIRPHIRRTPVLQMDGAEIGVNSCRMVLKLELFQHSGSFKTRGAFCNLLMREIPEAGVVAASGGNHGVAVAFTAAQLGRTARIFVPKVASPAKLDRIRSYGADLVITGELYADSLEASQEWALQTGALPVHAYDQTETLLGQGTVGLEFEDQYPELDTLLVAVGGGGLIGGIAAWYSGRIKVIGVEPEAAPTLTYALQAGHPVDAPAGGIAADSLAPRRVGELMFPIAQEYVHRMVLVSDDAIVRAQKTLWDKVRIVAEPGGAAAFAALLSRYYNPEPGERVGILICGGNTEGLRFKGEADVRLR
jgi:threonine dehydratase